MFAIHSDRSLLGPEATPHVPLLVPFWGINPEPPGDPSNGRYDRFAAVGTSFLRLTPLDECDAAVFPQSWEGVADDDEARARAESFAAACRDAGKPPVVFHWADAADRVPLDALVFRTSLYRSRRLATEFAQPAWSEDFVERYAGGELRVRRKGTRPVVGFCGHAPGEPPRPASLGGRLRRRPHGHHERARALRELESDPRVATNFLVRDDFWGGAPQSDAEALRRARGEYVRNIVDSDYVLCARGGGNFSYRLYEALSCGRIPVFVDTDCVLPLDFAVDWRDYCVWVDESELERIGERVCAFHERLSDAEFEDLQRSCRRFWETHVSPQGFFAHFHLHF